MNRFRNTLLNTKLEPFAILGGVFIFTALYYTRRLPLQILSAIILVAVTGYWSYAIRGKPGMSLRDFKLTGHRFGRNVLLAACLALLGWLYFSAYVHMTRGYWLRLSYGGSVPVILAIIAVSSAEELFFRGYLQNRLNRHFSLWRRVLITVLSIAVFKNIVHLWDGTSLTAHAELLLLGILHNILPSIWMEWSGSLVGPLLLHVFWDLLVYAPMNTIPNWII
jgi:membrane protease YdiL (CAAX protease family)